MTYTEGTMTTHLDQFISSLTSIDTETTGKDANVADVIEIGIAYYEDGSYRKYDHLFSPDTQELTYECSAVTNISKRMVQHSIKFKDYVSSDEVHPRLHDRPGETIMLAHNAQYDRIVLRRYGIEYKDHICTLAIAKRLFGDDPSVTAMNLPYLRYRFDILDPFYNEELSAHRAGDDALVTLHLMIYFLSVMIERNLVDVTKPIYPQIREWLDTPLVISVFPFGKHKGQKFDDIPVSYWKWALDNIDALDPDSEKYDVDLSTSVFNYLESKL